ncbi:MAG: long-chain fatty acid--CoA ligase [Xanthobacteraceae bacterium]|nr:long-chain fatty acid--CoA ligase [Xanthobacteraceae bacterium]
MSFRYYDWIRHHAQTREDKIAVIDIASDRRFDYREWDDRIGRLASYLRRIGVAKGDRIATLTSNCVEMLEVQFACFRVGAIFLPLNIRLTFSELEFIASDAGVSYLVFTPEFEPLARQLEAALKLKGTLGVGDAYEKALSNESPLADLCQMDITDVSTIMYTSGTTGRPKGATITHLMTFINCVNLGLPARVNPESTHINVLPLFHTGGLNCYTNPVLHAGGTVIVMQAFDASQFLQFMADPSLNITHMFGVPSIYQFLALAPEFETADLSRLQIAGVGGAPLPIEVLKTWQKRGVTLVQGYGMTETSPGVVCLDPRDAARKIGSAGKPLLHAEVKIVDPSGNAVKRGDIGEIWVRGPNITPGYWNRPDANAASFTDGWLHTGDLAREDEEGFIYIVDRSKDMYISGGENVYPAEIEDVLSQHPAVRECAVIGIADERWGEVGLAIIGLKDATQQPEADILAYCRSHLAKFKCPARLVFVDVIPRNATGKLDKPTLRAQYGG